MAGRGGVRIGFEMSKQTQSVPTSSPADPEVVIHFHSIPEMSDRELYAAARAFVGAYEQFALKRPHWGALMLELITGLFAELDRREIHGAWEPLLQ